MSSPMWTKVVVTNRPSIMLRTVVIHVRNIKEYNEKNPEKRGKFMPYIVVAEFGRSVTKGDSSCRRLGCAVGNAGTITTHPAPKVITGNATSQLPGGALLVTGDGPNAPSTVREPMGGSDMLWVGSRCLSIRQ